MNLEALVRDLAAQIVDGVLRGIRAQSAGGLHPGTVPTYSSNNLPPDAPSKARFNQLAKHVQGALKMGRVWVVPASAWHAHRAVSVRARCKPLPDAPVAGSDEEIAEQAVTLAGFRRTGR